MFTRDRGICETGYNIVILNLLGGTLFDIINIPLNVINKLPL